MDDQNTNVETSQRYLQFDLGAESYAIPLLNVKEVIPMPETTPLPDCPAYYVGIMNLRGQIISIVDFRKKLKIQPKENLEEEAVIIVEVDGVGIGLVVDSINRVLNVPESQVGEVPEIKFQVNAQYVQGVFKGSDKLTVLLDLENLLNLAEIRGLRQKAA